MGKDFNVFDMAESYAADNDLDGVDGLFTKPSEPETSQVKQNNESKINHMKTSEDEIEVKRKEAVVQSEETEWNPDEDLVSNMKELSSYPVTYTRDELIKEDEGLKNIADENTKASAIEAMDEMHRKLANIEEAKHRHGIKHFKIPEGDIQTRVLIAASDPKYQVAQRKLDELFNDIKLTYPEFIYQWEEDYKELAMNKEVERIKSENPYLVKEEDIIKVSDVAKQNLGFDKEGDESIVGTDPVEDIKIIIDKRNVPEISWDKDEYEKIRKSRTIELNIVEGKDIEFSEIKNAPDNLVDVILQPYTRKTNDLSVSLPASKYRCTISGLSYPEVLDLSTSTEMDNLAGERKKWSICYNHIHNQSIGPWEEYQWYIDPKTNKEVRIGYTDPAPEGIDDTKVYVVSKFEDFLKKTSHTDLDFLLWKILCATTMDEEIITIDCNALQPNGTTCNKSYDWIYRPTELLQMSLINESILQDMENTATVSSKEDIMKNYNSALLNSNNTITLKHSGFKIIFGHVSAYDYLNEIYSGIEAMKEDEDLTEIVSKGFNYILLTMIKGIIVPYNGSLMKITGVKNLAKTLNKLNEVDWLTIQKLLDMVIKPYEFKYMIKNTICPSCKHRTNINISNMFDMLFIITQSLNSVNVSFVGP